MLKRISDPHFVSDVKKLPKSWDKSTLDETIQLLVANEGLRTVYDVHPLEGRGNAMACHVPSNSIGHDKWVLVYRKTENEIEFLCTGSHNHCYSKSKCKSFHSSESVVGSTIIEQFNSQYSKLATSGPADFILISQLYEEFGTSGVSKNHKPLTRKKFVKLFQDSFPREFREFHKVTVKGGKIHTAENVVIGFTRRAID